MKMYVFVCKNITNIWAGIGAHLWAVSDAETQLAARKTRAQHVKIGHCGIIYCSDDKYKSLTTPFIFTSTPDINAFESEVWPEKWCMPFSILPLGSPRKHWNAHLAASALPFNANTNNTNVSSVFKAVGPAVFSPIEITIDDWSIILEQLSEK